MLEAASKGRHPSSANAAGPRQVISSGSTRVSSPSILFFCAHRMRSHNPYSGIVDAVAISSTPATVSNIFIAIISCLHGFVFAPQVSRFPAMELAAAGPAHQTSVPQTIVPPPPATALLPNHSSHPPADSSRSPYHLPVTPTPPVAICSVAVTALVEIVGSCAGVIAGGSAFAKSVGS